MFVISNLAFLTIILFISHSFVYSLPNPGEAKDEANDASNSAEEESEKEQGTISPKESEKEEVIANQEEPSETSAPEEIKEEEKELEEELPESVEEDLSNQGDLKNVVPLLALFDKIESETSDEEEKEIEKSPAEMKEMKDEVFKLTNELNAREGLHAVPDKEFDQVWGKKKEEYGKKFPARVEKLIVLFKEKEKKEPTTEVSESELSTESSDISKEQPKDAFFVKGPDEKICILAKFHSDIKITYSGQGPEEKVEVSVPKDVDTKGECAGDDKPPSMEFSWDKFILALKFDKTSEETWAVTSVELSYDKSEPVFDGAVDRVKVTGRSKESYFETPIGKSYYCPGLEVIPLYSEHQHIASVHLKELYLQPYEVEDGKFSKSHRCNQVVIGGLDEEPFVQDETIPLAVGCTLALITLLILIGFSVHRAYNAAKVDYNAVP